MRQVMIGSIQGSRLGFGCYALSGAYGAGREAEARAGGWEALIRRAHDLGVTFFDTAEVYGGAEEILGRAVRPFRDQVAIATKVGVSPSGERDASPGRVKASARRA